MYMVTRWFAPDVEQRTAPKSAGSRPRSVRLIDEQTGNAIAVLARNDFDTREQVDHYVCDYP